MYFTAKIETRRMAVLLALLFVFPIAALGDERCLTAADAQRIISSFGLQDKGSEDKKLRKELIDMVRSARK